MNFVIQTKHLKGESSKSARKTAKVKHNRRLCFTSVYKAHYSTYSYTGQNWMNRARKCLQSSLVSFVLLFSCIFWTIRESFVGGLDTAWESIRAMWNVGIDCGAQNISQCFEQAIKRNIWIVKIRISRFDNRSVPFP